MCGIVNLNNIPEFRLSKFKLRYLDFNVNRRGVINFECVLNMIFSINYQHSRTILNTAYNNYSASNFSETVSLTPIATSPLSWQFSSSTSMGYSKNSIDIGNHFNTFSEVVNSALGYNIKSTYKLFSNFDLRWNGGEEHRIFAKIHADGFFRRIDALF